MTLPTCHQKHSVTAKYRPIKSTTTWQVMRHKWPDMKIQVKLPTIVFGYIQCFPGCWSVQRSNTLQKNLYQQSLQSLGSYTLDCGILAGTWCFTHCITVCQTISPVSFRKTSVNLMKETRKWHDREYSTGVKVPRKCHQFIQIFTIHRNNCIRLNAIECHRRKRV